MPKQPGKLANKSTREVQSLLRHYGFTLDAAGPHERWVSGSGAAARYVIVPAKREAIAPKTLASILEQAGVSKAQARRFWSARGAKRK